jgi:hypothetical protein
MPYDPTLATTRDQVRFYVGDTDDDNLLLTDPEVEFLLTEEPDVKLAAADAANVIAAKFARDTNYRFSTLWADAGDAYDHFIKLGERLRAGTVATVGPTLISSEAVSDDEFESQFTIGIHDSP